jgi:DNA-binding NtrC family response regulator
MAPSTKSILIVDEVGFSRICSAILEHEGYNTQCVADENHFELSSNNDSIGLVITSYPYGARLIKKLAATKIPAIILSDRIGSDIVSALECLNKSHCLIKPIDYNKFRTLVSQTLAR